MTVTVALLSRKLLGVLVVRFEFDRGCFRSATGPRTRSGRATLRESLSARSGCVRTGAVFRCPRPWRVSPCAAILTFLRRAGTFRGMKTRPLLFVLVLSCASAPPSAPAPAPGSAKPLPASSIAAVLMHREELGLTDQQCRQLNELATALDKQNGELRASPAATHSDEASHEEPGQADHAPIPGTGARGAGGRGKRRSAGRSDSRPQPDFRQAVLRAMDDNDTQAYLQAEALLTPSQRERARDIAEEYREARYDEREHPPKEGPPVAPSK